MQPTPDNSDVISNIIFIGAAIIWGLIGTILVRYRRKHRKFKSRNSSILLTYYTEGVELMPLKSGTFGSMHYTAMAASPATYEGGEAALIYQVLLPFSTKVHLVGIPKKWGATQLYPAGVDSVMERVDLEGDYNDFFTLYAEKGMQEDARYALDPKAMVFTIDFCQSHNWEIVGNMLYFVQATPNAPVDPTNMADDVVKFVNEVRPALAAALSDQQIELTTPYNQEYRTDLHCPICNAVLENKGHYLSCPKGDGILLNGAALEQLHKGGLKIPGFSKNSSKRRKDNIVCPSCGHTMEQIAYNGGSTIIDTCTHCPYRWLDSGEANALGGKQL